jgi:hypothetical protein
MKEARFVYLRFGIRIAEETVFVGKLELKYGSDLETGPTGITLLASQGYLCWKSSEMFERRARLELLHGIICST